MSGGTSCVLSPVRWMVWSGYSAEISASFSVIINCSWGRSVHSDSLSIRSTTVETSSHLISGLPSQARLFCFSFFFFFWNQFSMVDFSKLIRLSLGTSALCLHNYHSSASIPLSERNTFILRLAVIIVMTHHQGRANRSVLYTHVLVYLDVSPMHNLNGNYKAYILWKRVLVAVNNAYDQCFLVRFQLIAILSSIFFVVAFHADCTQVMSLPYVKLCINENPYLIY